ncbi:SDR family NAD(P)-dependent oxidoreductase [Mycolicibacterium vaccae]|uniref:SDR family NAD(P)-dependent oxidoreductase n=1 Tax=Mycolicibacterium vaccae TaxID=1810 RepID=UPI003CE9864D
MTDHASRIVVITGASDGIGRHTALRFASEGARLLLAARDAEALGAVAAECLDRGARAALSQPTDIADRGQVGRMFDRVRSELGSPDVVVQNASVAVIGRLTDIPLDIIDTVIRTDVLGAVYVAREAVRQFQAGGSGALIVVGSLFGHVPVPLLGPYVISKFAVTALIRVLRQELRDQPGITVTGIYPGAVDTGIYRHAANYLGRVPRVPPLAEQPEKIAAAIVDAAHRRRSGERQIGVMNVPLLVGYRLLPRVLYRLAEPAGKLIGFTARRTPPRRGNTRADGHG